MNYIVNTKKLTKIYDGVVAVNGVDLKIKKGDIYAIVGPNGSGKTTIMKLLTNLIKPSEGSIELFGEKLTPNSFHLNSKIGSIIEKPTFYEKLSGRENLNIHCEYLGYYNKSAVDESLEIVGLDYITSKSVSNYSVGMKQRLGLARAVISRPELLILDEPIQGIDPEGIIEIRSLLKRLSEVYGTTVFVSSHILSEVEQMANQIGFIDKGNIVNEINISKLSSSDRKYYEINCSDNSKALIVLDSLFNSKDYKLYDNSIRIYNTDIELQSILYKLMNEGINIDSFNKKTTSLEEYYMNTIFRNNNDVENK